MSSTLDLVPREQSARGTGSNTEPTAWIPPPAASCALGQAVARATRPDYVDWLAHVQAAAGCTRPVRLTGSLLTVRMDTDRQNATVLDERHTDQLPDATIYKACGNRRTSVCPSCAQTYQRDAYQLLRAGLAGGKGVPESVSTHPAVFVTLTAPSFGLVHTRTVTTHTCGDRKRCDCRANPCHARRDAGPCDHGAPAVCWARHESGDPLLGQPLCLDCYDHDHHVVWNLFAAELWHRTKQAAERSLKKLCRQRGIPFHPVVTDTDKIRYVSPVRLSHGKAAEMQRRAAVHFHALVRLDGYNPADPTAVVAPPAGITLADVTAALHAAAAEITFTTPSHPDQPDGWPMAWGDEGKGRYADIRTITHGITGEVTDAMVAGYLAKYATKSTEATGHTSTRITADNVDEHADPAGAHTTRLIDACWRIGRPTHTPAPLGSRPTPGRPKPDRASPFGDPWDCETCGTRTRYVACPVCVGKRQASLDTEPSTPAHPNLYARLRRWAHMLGYGGHFLTKARRYSVTFGELRATRVQFRREHEHAPVDEHTGTVRAVDHHTADTTLIVGALTFAGVGWHTTGDALLANTAAALARSRHQTGREELAHELGTLNAGMEPAAA